MPVTFYPSQKELTACKRTAPLERHKFGHLSHHFVVNARRDCCIELLQSSLAASDPIVHVKNGLVHSLLEAYNNHHAISLRPDDIWIAILVQFSFFVNANAEELRNKFVAHQGKKELKVEAHGSRYTVDFGYLSRLMTREIRKNVTDPEVCNWILPSFSTTSDNDVVVASVVMMATMKKYFSYTMSMLCGIPQVTLEGEKSDWELILARIEKLKEYGPQTTAWFKLLKPVITRFVRAFDSPESDENLSFWNHVASILDTGSGMSYLDGWINAFCVFDPDGKWLGMDLEKPNAPNTKRKDDALVLDGVVYHRVEMENIPAASAEVDVKLNDNGEVFETMMIAGMIGFQVQDTEHVKRGLLKPLPGWWMFVNRSQSEIDEEVRLEKEQKLARRIESVVQSRKESYGGSSIGPDPFA